MRSIDRLRWLRLLESGALTETYGRWEIVIRCHRCVQYYARERTCGRRTTIADRLAAMQHVETAHPQQFAEATNPTACEAR